MMWCIVLFSYVNHYGAWVNQKSITYHYGARVNQESITNELIPNLTFREQDFGKWGHITWIELLQV